MRPDIGGFFYYQPAVQRTSIVDVKIPPGLKVGYIMGAGDDIPPVLRQIGLDVTLLTPEDVPRRNLQRFGTIVLGIRAYDTRDGRKEEQSAPARLCARWRNAAGAVQHRPRDFNAGNYHAVSSESQPRSRYGGSRRPLLCSTRTTKCSIIRTRSRKHDFNGWVQERGLYFMEQWDPQFTPLLASNDPGEPPQKGGLLLAQYGKGYYIYTGYAFFRQLPFGVPGAIRLYVNLLSVGHAPR